MFHQLAHFLRLNLGQIKTWNFLGKIWVGFECRKCGEVDDLYVVYPEEGEPPSKERQQY